MVMEPFYTRASGRGPARPSPPGVDPVLPHGLVRERIRQIEKHAPVELKKLARGTGFESAA
ncbi:hypothetical protein QR77_00285 [Streptomyces sp. 150FB]|nr:hypothetical protein QR77_00285 [Streptomyces sp. 150FB]